MAKVLMVDPPSGWRYGFPKVIPEGAKIAEFYLKNGYPEDEIEFAVRWTRMWEVDEVEGNEQAGPQGETQGEAKVGCSKADQPQSYRQGPTDAEVPAADRA